MMRAVKLCIYTLLEVAACVSFIMCESRTHPHVFDCCFLYRNIYIYTPQGEDTTKLFMEFQLKDKDRINQVIKFGGGQGPCVF